MRLVARTATTPTLVAPCLITAPMERDRMQKVFADLTPHQQRLLLKACWEGVPLDDPICTPQRIKKP